MHNLIFTDVLRPQFNTIVLRTEEHDVPLSDRTARVFELFFLDIPGFSGFLLLSYPVCGP